MRNMMLLSVVGMLTFGPLMCLDAQAIENFEGDVVAECGEHDGVTYNLKATITAPNWYLDRVQYQLTPQPAQLTSVDLNLKVRYFAVTPGTYTVQVVDQGEAGRSRIAVPDCSSSRRGMTWRHIQTNVPSGTIRVGCGNQECNAYQGDTTCDSALPILCIKKSGPGFPLPLPVGVDNSSQYNKWSGGVVATTPAMVPPTQRVKANEVCVHYFGQGWRVAEFHDGWGWYFQAYGGVGNPSSRFWVDISDQPLGRCWD